MSTYYDYHGEIRHCSKRELQHENDEAHSTIEFIKNELLMLAITTPPATGTINMGDGEDLWGDYVTSRVRELFEDLADAQYRAVVTGQAIEVMEEDPGSVTDDSDGFVPWTDQSTTTKAGDTNEAVDKRTIKASGYR